MEHHRGTLRPPVAMLVTLRQPALIGAIALLVAACSGGFTAPPSSASPDTVLRAYLEALSRGDCSAGKVLATETFRVGNGELCGATHVTSYTIGGAAPSPFSDEVVFATTLVTTGTGDGSVQPGSMTWFYDLKRQPDGAWRLAGGGSGP